MITRRRFAERSTLAIMSGSAFAADPSADGLVHVERGSLPIVLTAPHGGGQPVPGVEPRNMAGKPAGGADYVVSRDGGTDRLAEGVAAEIQRATRNRAYLVVARFHRKYIDANRPAHIAFDNATARPHYEAYHRAIRGFVDEIRARHSAGLLIDIHGQSKFPDAVVRGTINGRAVTRLVARAGISAITGLDGVFGQLERNGFRVLPANDVPPSGKNEDPAFSGGYTTSLYGSHRPEGIDAVQFEFGSRYRQKSEIDRTVKAAAAAIVGFYKTYLI